MAYAPGLYPVHRSDALEMLARFGYLTKGLVYLFVGGLALLYGLGEGGALTGKDGAVKTIGDLNVPGRWALLFDDAGNKLPIYGNRVLADTRAMWPNLPDQGAVVTVPSTPEEPVPDPIDTSKLVTGRVPMPPVIDRIVSKPK